MAEIVVFISSSMDELHNERKAVRRAFKRLKKMGLAIHSYAFELDTGADPAQKHEVWRMKLEASNVYVGLFFRKYGTYTIDEFQIARSANYPCFLYVLDFGQSLP